MQERIILKQIARLLRVQEEDVPKTLERFKREIEKK